MPSVNLAVVRLMTNDDGPRARCLINYFCPDEEIMHLRDASAVTTVPIVASLPNSLDFSLLLSRFLRLRKQLISD